MSKIFNHQSYEKPQTSITSITAGSIDKAQREIYEFFLKNVKLYAPAIILNQFKRLFILYEEIENINVYYALGEIIFHNKESEFKSVLLRCCYILNNNWSVNGYIEFCQQLVDLFLADSIGIPTKITKLRTLRKWLQQFVQSTEYITLRSLSGGATVRKQYHAWPERFSSYLLVSEYTDSSKPLEQRQYAENLSRRLKKQFKFELALYTAKMDVSATGKPQQSNPTSLGDGVLQLIKKVLNKQGNQQFRSRAKSFLEQSKEMLFGEFKTNLLIYLGIEPTTKQEIAVSSYKMIRQKLLNLQTDQDNHVVSFSLLNITCNRLFRWILLDEYRHPSSLLNKVLEERNFLHLVILLLKIILFFPSCRIYLESYIAELVKYYSGYEESECVDFINLLDILNVTLAIFDNDTDYSLVKMAHPHFPQQLPYAPNSHYRDHPSNHEHDDDADLDNYRIFSQTKKLPNNDQEAAMELLDPS
ncbi:MAG: hypothetical protein NW214_07390 [Pseudanabaenaceae cyanobacterium bins.39]|nr:hypothetical protein [Pseudanabaenaceae cyanobacterium bins.39]